MRISDMLGKGSIRVPLNSNKRSAVIAELCDALLPEFGEREHKEALAAVMARERLASTGIGKGVAVPHAGTSLFDEIRVTIGISHAGVEFHGVDDEPVKLIFLVLYPEHRPRQQIRMLARISRLMRDEELRARLVTSTDAGDLVAALKAYEDEHFG